MWESQEINALSLLTYDATDGIAVAVLHNRTTERRMT